MKYFSIVLWFSFLTLTTFAQSPAVNWSVTFGSANAEWCKSVKQTADNGFILAGWTEYPIITNTDIRLVKTDSAGDTIWTRTLGDNYPEWAYSARQTTDGGYIVCATKNLYALTGRQIMLLKTDSLGTESWTQYFGADGDDVVFSTEQTLDGGFILTSSYFGSGGQDLVLIKTDATGTETWTKVFAGSGSDQGAAVMQTQDQGYIITEVTSSYGAGGTDCWLIKTDSNGDSTWTRTFGGNGADFGKSVQETADGGFIVTGYTTSFGDPSGEANMWLIKTDSNGDSTWTRTFGGAGYERGECVTPTLDGGYLLCGYSNAAGTTDAWIVKTDATGETSWTKTLGGTGADAAYSIQQLADGATIIAGHTSSIGAGGTDYWLIKLNPEETTAIQENPLAAPTFKLTGNFPNPFNPVSTIEYVIPETAHVHLIVYNTLGQTIKSLVNETQRPGRYRIPFNGSRLPSGLYFYRLKCDDYSADGKMLLIK